MVEVEDIGAELQRRSLDGLRQRTSSRESPCWVFASRFHPLLLLAAIAAVIRT
jgi:hypothetical protein